MLLQVFAIPSALALSMIFLGIRYYWNHYVALIFCAGGVACSVLNDLVLNPTQKQNEFTLTAFWGDIMVLGGAFLYAL